MTELPLHNSLQKNQIDFTFYSLQMKKFKLVKDKWYFQSLRETKSVKELDDWAVEISWYASTKDKDRWWDVVEPKAFASALERYMTNPIVLLQHKTDKPIGVVEEADIDDNWLYIKAKISQNTDWVVDLIKNWVLRAFSIWYSVKDYETDVRELADWTYDMTNIIKDLELYEISVVSIPMNPYALSKSIEDLLEVEETVEEKKEEVVESEKVESSENDETAETESTEESENAEDEKKEEETTDDNWAESEKSEEKEAEWTNIQSEEKSAEIESSEKEESEEEWKVVEWEIVQGDEEVVEDESTESESEEKAPTDDEEKKECSTDEEIAETVEETKADENSEISDEESNEEDSENDVETTSDDEVVDETSNNEVVETKSIETESQKQFDFESKIAQLSKSFDEKLAEKDEKIKSLESKVETMTKLFAESLETIDKMTTAVKNTPVNAGLQYKRPLKKWWYYDIASIIKNL